MGRREKKISGIGDGMEGSRLTGDAKTNDAKKTGNVPALQSMQKTIRSELLVVAPHLPKPSVDLPHPILPKLIAGLVVRIGTVSTSSLLPRYPSLRSASFGINFSSLACRWTRRTVPIVMGSKRLTTVAARGANVLEPSGWNWSWSFVPGRYSSSPLVTGAIEIHGWLA
ncbi:uncharacterized protein BT62DRAFT_937137 [Guyanagaster necrorhizus]|uniref:Uncharacterized protein n=1 Tax=Guyanagaster necrorhizus TaxID=856835 RepID=A0A9P7VIZ8_9AGAR|nr:uncharacterized protein BT62DRAFT_937137 [Guyanagaster necrorhizus MCA 3950]KAG7441372.1 hypothetical protein BT62DRAFT_937137 [Guyanagaster necrorhizus MCA 3950]